MNALKQNATLVFVAGKPFFVVSGQRHKERAGNWAAARFRMVENFAKGRGLDAWWIAENGSATLPIHYCPAGGHLPPLTF